MKAIWHRAELDAGRLADAERLRKSPEWSQPTEEAAGKVNTLLSASGKSSAELWADVDAGLARVDEAKAARDQSRQVLMDTMANPGIECWGYSADQFDQHGNLRSGEERRLIDFRCLHGTHWVDDDNCIVAKGKPPRYYVVHFANDQIEQLLPGLRQRVRERLGLPSSAEISTADPKLQADRPAKETAARGVRRHPAGVLDPPHLSSQGRRQTGPRPLKREGVVEGMLADYSADASALASEKQETLRARYGVSRDTAEKARRVALEKLNSDELRQTPIIDK